MNKLTKAIKKDKLYTMSGGEKYYLIFRNINGLNTRITGTKKQLLKEQNELRKIHVSSKIVVI